MTTIGIDPGYGRLGVAVIVRQPAERGRQDDLIFSACWETSARQSFDERLGELGAKLEKLFGDYPNARVGLEKIFFATNQRTAIQVAEARGMIRYLATRHNLPVIELTPLQVKMALTGYGRASKEQVNQMVTKLIKLPPKKRLDDEIDAIGIALAAAARANYPQSRLARVAK